MNIKEYIASGILELYVLGLLSEIESYEVARLVEQYPELQKEVVQIEQSVKSYADSISIKPKPGFEELILDKIDTTIQVPGSKIQVSPASSIPVKQNNTLLYVLGALALGALLFAFWNYSRLKKVQDEARRDKLTLEELRKDCADKDLVIQQMTRQLEILLNPANRQVILAGADNALNAVASVYYNTTEQKTYLNVGNLTEAPEDRFYQLWALVEGQPVDMGEIQITASGDTLLIEVPYIPEAGAFAITLEPRDGDPAPNLDEIQVFGNVS